MPQNPTGTFSCFSLPNCYPMLRDMQNLPHDRYYCRQYNYFGNMIDTRFLIRKLIINLIASQFSKSSLQATAPLSWIQLQRVDCAASGAQLCVASGCALFAATANLPIRLITAEVLPPSREFSWRCKSSKATGCRVFVDWEMLWAGF